MNTNTNINTNIDYLEQIKFYADTPIHKNKFFCWKLTSVLTLKEALFRFFDKGWTIRAAWYQKVDVMTGEVLENPKLNVQSLFDEWLATKNH